MTKIIMLALFLLLAVIYQSLSPVKVRMILLAIRSLSFGTIYIWTSSLWFPAIMYLVFIGGILIMFIILSSILPNIRSPKNQKIFFWPAILFLIYIIIGQNKLTELTNLSIKNLLSSSITIIFFFFSITAYFVFVIIMLRIRRAPLRRVV